MSDDSKAQAARMLHQAMVLVGNEGKVSEAIALAEQSLQTFDEVGDVQGAAAAHHMLSMMLARVGRAAEAHDHLETAIAARAESSDPESLSALHQQRFGLALQLGDIDKARAAAEALLALQEQTGDRSGQANAIHQFVQFLIQEGDLERAEELLGRGMWLTDRAGEERGRSALFLLSAQVDLSRGNAERAINRTREAIQIARSVQHRPAAIEGLHQLGVMLVGRGDLEGARSALEEALDGREAIRDLDGRAATLMQLAGLEQTLGRTSDALGRLEYAAKTYGELGNIGGQATALHTAGALADESGDLARGLSLGHQLIEACVRMEDLEAVAAARFGQGTRLAMAGRLEDACAAFDQASRDHLAAGHAESSWISKGMLGQVQAALGQQALAIATLREALIELQGLGSTSAEGVAQLLAEIEAS